jgi:hypothetical protein
MVSESETRAARRRKLRLSALLVLALAATLPLRRKMAAESAVSASTPDLLYVTSGETLRRLCLGYNGLLADLYWTRAVQYFGRQKLRRATEFNALGPLLTVATRLDPQLLIAYRFGAVFLAEKPPAGAGQPLEALALLRRGIVANPDYWRLWQDLGFIEYWDLHDYPAAARAFEIGSERPGAELWMKTLAATVAAKGGRLATSQALWSEIYRQAQNESIRASAREHLEALRAQEEINHLDILLAEYRKSQGRAAVSLTDLVRAGMLPAVPVDPSGVPYAVGRDGRAAVSPQSGVNLALAQ